MSRRRRHKNRPLPMSEQQPQQGAPTPNVQPQASVSDIIATADRVGLVIQALIQAGNVGPAACVAAGLRLFALGAMGLGLPVSGPTAQGFLDGMEGLLPPEVVKQGREASGLAPSIITPTEAEVADPG